MYKIQKQQNKILQFKELINAFLLFSYARLSKKQKEKILKDGMPEIIFRTTKIEEPWITREDIRKALLRK